MDRVVSAAFAEPGSSTISAVVATGRVVAVGDFLVAVVLAGDGLGVALGVELWVAVVGALLGADVLDGGALVAAAVGEEMAVVIARLDVVSCTDEVTATVADDADETEPGSEVVVHPAVRPTAAASATATNVRERQPRRVLIPFPFGSRDLDDHSGHALK